MELFPKLPLFLFILISIPAFITYIFTPFFHLSYNFRARPVDPRVMSKLNVGVMRPQHKEPTKIVEFNLESEKRFQEREAHKKHEEVEETYEFHARPVNTKMLEGPIVSHVLDL